MAFAFSSSSLFTPDRSSIALTIVRHDEPSCSASCCASSSVSSFGSISPCNTCNASSLAMFTRTVCSPRT